MGRKQIAPFRKVGCISSGNKSTIFWKFHIYLQKILTFSQRYFYNRISGRFFCIPSAHLVFLSHPNQKVAATCWKCQGVDHTWHGNSKQLFQGFMFIRVNLPQTNISIHWPCNITFWNTIIVKDELGNFNIILHNLVTILYRENEVGVIGNTNTQSATLYKLNGST